MVQRKTGHDRFGQEDERSLGPEMMKRPRSSKQTTPEKQRIVTGGSPNYMKGTKSSEGRKQSQDGSDKKMQTGKKLDSCCGDKKESSNRVLTKGVSFKRSCRIGLFGDVNAHRATCSSFLKDSKFTEYTSPGVLKLCCYKYCSLNAHLHRQYPPLKSFISARRRSLKSRTSVKMSGDDGCVEHENGSTREVDIQVIDSEAENMDIECNEDLETLADAESCGSGDEKMGIMIDKFAILEQSENESIIHCLVKNAFDEKLTSKKAEDGEKAEERVEPISKTEDTRARKPCNKEDWREFNPREPNYLPVVEEPSSEKVELKHQDMDERKNAQEWMIDYALQHIVSKLALERKKKVALLVEAFETILPREPSSFQLT